MEEIALRQMSLLFQDYLYLYKRNKAVVCKYMPIYTPIAPEISIIFERVQPCGVSSFKYAYI